MYLIRPTRLGMLEEATDDEAAVVREHFAYLQRLRNEGLVVLAGPSVAGEDTFGIVVLETEHEQAARAAMEADPAVAKGVMRAELRPFRIAVARD